jgi:hypothetical protein
LVSLMSFSDDHSSMFFLFSLSILFLFYKKLGVVSLFISDSSVF